MRPPIVFIPNKSSHDFSDAHRFGDLVFLTVGTVKRYNTNSLYREMIDGLAGAEPQDYLLVSSLSILNLLAAAILSRKFGRLNLLLYCNGVYVERIVEIDALLD